MKISTPMMTVIAGIGSVGGALFFTWISIAGNNSLVLPALGALLMLVICFLSVKTALTILVMSMLLSPEIGIGSTEKRDITIRFDDLLLLIVTFGWFLRMAVLKDIGFMRKNPLNGPILSFCAVAILSTALGVMHGNVDALAGTFFVLKLIEYFFLFYMIINYVETGSEIMFFIRILLLVCGIVCVYGLIQVATGGDVAAPFEGSAGERNTLGGYLVLIASVTGGMLFYRDKNRTALNLALLLGAIIMTLLFSMSRSGWSGLLFSYAALFLIARKFRYFIVVLLILAPLTPFLIPKKAKERFEYTFSEGYAAHRKQIKVFGIQLDGSSSARLRSYGLVLQELPKRLLFGYGITGFAFIDGQFFRVLSEMGTVGFGIFIWLLASVYRLAAATKQLPITDSMKGVIVGFQAGFWGIIMHAMTANTFIIIRIAEPFWFLVGLITVMQLVYNNTPPSLAQKAGVADAENTPGVAL